MTSAQRFALVINYSERAVSQPSIFTRFRSENAQLVEDLPYHRRENAKRTFQYVECSSDEDGQRFGKMCVRSRNLVKTEGLTRLDDGDASLI